MPFSLGLTQAYVVYPVNLAGYRTYVQSREFGVLGYAARRVYDSAFIIPL